MPPSAREAEFIQQLQERDERLKRLEQENALLRQKIDLLVRRIFGPSSEALEPGQLELLLGGLAGPDVEAGKADASSAAEEANLELCKGASPRRRRKKSESRYPSDLPILEEVIEPTEVQLAPQQWRCIGQEISEQLDYEPAKFLRRRLIRPKYVHRQELDQPPVIAPLPESLQERCQAAPGLLAQIIAAKFCEHLPLYRQEMIYEMRHDVYLPRQSMARWMGLAAFWLQPIYELIRTEVLAGGYLQADETPVKYLAPGHGSTKQGYLWTYQRPGGEVLYDWQTSRAANCLNNVIPADFTGVIQCDGYSAYKAFGKERGESITLAGCWAHARRNFFEAREQAPKHAGWILRQIGHLYRIEAKLRECRAGPALREAMRAHQSRPIHERIRCALEKLKIRKHHLPQSRMGQAIDYALGHWTMLSVYLQDGRVEIDNNLVENAIRPTAVGKKNWLFIGDADTGDRSAILYTIVQSCRRHEIDPFTYLRDVLTRLPKMTNQQIEEVSPKAWVQARRQKHSSLPKAA